MKAECINNKRNTKKTQIKKKQGMNERNEGMKRMKGTNKGRK